MINITPIIEALVSLLLAVVTAFLIPFIREKLGDFKYSRLESAIRLFVDAAEQLYGSGQGEKKLQYVLERAKEKIEKLGITIDPEELRAIIEAAVFDLNDGEVY